MLLLKMVKPLPPRRAGGIRNPALPDSVERVETGVPR